MKYIRPYLLLSFLLISMLAYSQPSNKPLSNFSLPDPKGNIQYQWVFKDSLDNISSITRKIGMLMKLDTSEMTNIIMDSSYHLCAGKIQNMHIDFYGVNRLLSGSFTIEIKPGRYRLTIKDMMWKGPIAIITTDQQTLEENCLNDKGDMWTTLAFRIFPQMDALFKSKFQIPVSAGGDGW